MGRVSADQEVRGLSSVTFLHLPFLSRLSKEPNQLCSKEGEQEECKEFGQEEEETAPMEAEEEKEEQERSFVSFCWLDVWPGGTE